MVWLVFGTRPEYLKLLSLYQALSKLNLEVVMVFTAQHSSLVHELGSEDYQNLDILELEKNLDTLSIPQKLAEILSFLSEKYELARPRYIVAQGDTLTVLAASLFSYLSQTPFGHLEAGLRSNDYDEPWPEEYIRTVADIDAHHYFCPTLEDTYNLRNRRGEIHEVGNTSIDNLKLEMQTSTVPSHCDILITMHRRENHVSVISNLFQTLNLYSNQRSIKIVWVLHPNPNSQIGL
ncbi:UDP-N-acetylglucosamine 2-epimerase, partial [Planktomarina temperata]|nr:UDP-N-acetylglucosamine 2-epimerase [Planktomarina temperata]